MFNLRKLFTAAIQVATSITRAARQEMAVPKARPAAPGPRKRGDKCLRVNVVNDRSRYMPHHGKNETLRRRMGGFFGVASLADRMDKTRGEVLDLYRAAL